MPLELMPTRLERFVELRRSAWLSTSILWSAKDIPPVMPPPPASSVSEPTHGKMGEMSEALRNEVYSSEMPRVARNHGTEGDSSGIKWRYVTQGSQLQEASCRHRGDAAFARKSYIDGVVYMLKGLPDDMDELETAAIRRAAADACNDRGGEAGQLTATTNTAHPLQARYRRPSGGGGGEKTLLHRSVQRIVAALVLLAHLLFCLFKEGVRVGARYEREYSISRLLVERGLVVASAVGQHGVALKERIHAMTESQAGHAMGALSLWALENVVAGVQDGLGEGFQLVNRRP